MRVTTFFQNGRSTWWWSAPMIPYMINIRSCFTFSRCTTTPVTSWTTWASRLPGSVPVPQGSGAAIGRRGGTRTRVSNEKWGLPCSFCSCWVGRWMAQKHRNLTLLWSFHFHQFFKHMPRYTREHPNGCKQRFPRHFCPNFAQETRMHSTVQ